MQIADVTVDAQGPKAVPLFCLAHGAGGDMHADLLVKVQQGLLQAGFAVARFNFPYTESGRKAPDKAPLLMQTISQVATELRRRLKPSRLLLGGKSMGGRMASMLVSEGYAADGLVFLGYPLHPMGKPEQLRTAHLSAIHCPMLFVSGSHDALARLDLLQAALVPLGANARLALLDQGDHSLSARGVDGAAFAVDAMRSWYQDHWPAAATRPSPPPAREPRRKA